MSEHKEKALEILEQYPKENRVYVTKDGTVFLENNKRHAQNHANTIGGNLEVVKRPVKSVAKPEGEQDPKNEAGHAGSDTIKSVAKPEGEQDPKPKSKAKPKGKAEPETETPE